MRPAHDDLAPAADATARWGDERILTFGPILGVTSVSSELLRVNLDQDPGSKLIGSRVCRVNLHADVIDGDSAAGGAVGTLLLDLHIGNGSMATRIRNRYQSLPQVPTTPGANGVELDATWELPLTHIYGRIAVTAILCSVRVQLWLTPVMWSVEDLARGGR